MWSRCLEWGRGGAGKHGWRECCGVVVGTLFQRLCSYLSQLILRPSVCVLSYGAGTQFPRNPRAEDVLAELAAELIRLEDDTH
jgi:hypothetical protein